MQPAGLIEVSPQVSVCVCDRVSILRYALVIFGCYGCKHMRTGVQYSHKNSSERETEALEVAARHDALG